MKSNKEELDDSSAQEEMDISFLQDNRFGIFFAGPLIYGDVLQLPKHVKKVLISKLQGELSQDIIIKSADCV